MKPTVALDGVRGAYAGLLRDVASLPMHPVVREATLVRALLPLGTDTAGYYACELVERADSGWRREVTGLAEAAAGLMFPLTEVIEACAAVTSQATGGGSGGTGTGGGSEVSPPVPPNPWEVPWRC